MKSLKITLAAALMGFTFGIVGCGDTSSVTEEKTVTTPGGTTKETHETEIKQTGDNPPPATTTEPAAPK